MSTPGMVETPGILIVEDEPLIAMMLEDYLDTLGYRVVGTADAVSGALDLVAGSAFDAAILDVNLRGGEAWPVADALAERRRPFVLTTGGGENRPPRHGDVPVLAKPFTMEGVRAVMEGLLRPRPVSQSS